MVEICDINAIGNEVSHIKSIEYECYGQWSLIILFSPSSSFPWDMAYFLIIIKYHFFSFFLPIPDTFMADTCICCFLLTRKHVFFFSLSLDSKQFFSPYMYLVFKHSSMRFRIAIYVFTIIMITQCNMRRECAKFSKLKTI